MFKKLFVFLIAVALIFTATAFLTYQKLPENTERPPSQWLAPNPQGRLAQVLLPQAEAHPQLSGVYPFADGLSAFLARLALAENAEYSIDAQYYIWHNDTAGHLLLQALYRAAERGVRVRLLLDDNNTQGMDGLLLTLDRHPNAEVRLFNPFMQRSFRPIAYLSDFFRLNRRMHNKSFNVDGVISIIGGRNIGDEYFGAGDGVMFADLDVSVIGAIVPAIENDFDRYWISESTYPATSIIPADTAPIAITPAPRDDAATRNYLERLRAADFVADLQSERLDLRWAPAQLFSDDPGKGLGKAQYADTVIAHLEPLFASAEREIVIVSPYFVPTQRGSDTLSRTAQSGKAVTVLTNSLAATDVAAVHAGYAKYRKPLLEAGITLYELKPEASFQPQGRAGLIGSLGSSGSSLHAKTFSIDGEKLFVGSFNMDPRSATLNTEMGIVFDLPELAASLKTGLDQHMPSHAYQVSLTADYELQWKDKDDVYGKEPQSTALKRFSVLLLSWLPIEHLL